MGRAGVGGGGEESSMVHARVSVCVCMGTPRHCQRISIDRDRDKATRRGARLVTVQCRCKVCGWRPRLIIHPIDKLVRAYIQSAHSSGSWPFISLRRNNAQTCQKKRRRGALLLSSIEACGDGLMDGMRGGQYGPSRKRLSFFFDLRKDANAPKYSTQENKKTKHKQENRKQKTENRKQ